MLGRTMLGKLPLVSTSFANLTTDDGLEAVSIATDYEKLIPIHYFYFPMILQVLRTQGPKVPCNGAAKEPHIVLECVLASTVQLVFETLFRCFRRTSLEGGVSLARGA
jgi:hypothetical protein